MAGEDALLLATL